MNTQRSKGPIQSVERFTEGSALTDLLPVLRSWSRQIGSQLHGHVSGQQPSWLSYSEAVAQWADSARKIGWQAQVVTPKSGQPGWDILMDSPAGDRLFAVWAVGLKPSLADGTASSLIEQGIGLARQNASGLRAGNGRARLVLALITPYLRSDESLTEDISSVVDRWLTDLLSPIGRTASIFVLGASGDFSNAAGWHFPAVGVVATLV